MPSQADIDRLKAEIRSANPKQAQQAAAHLISVDREVALTYLISLLESTHPPLRNTAALGLHELADNRTLEPLFAAINNPNNTNSRGTLVYALEALQCSNKLEEVFDLLFYGNYEVKTGAATILNEQEFEFNKQELLTVQRKWNHIQSHPEECPYYDKCKEDIEDFVSSYPSYLKKFD